LRWCLFCLVSVCCKAFVDYSSSGLENPLTNLLVLAIYGVVLISPEDDGSPYERHLFSITLLSSLAFLSRADSSLITAPVLLWVTIQSFRRHGFFLSTSKIVLGASPVVFWSVFSYWYYGSIFPNTAYSKLGGFPFWETVLHRNSLEYFRSAMAWDPVGVVAIRVVVAAGFGLLLKKRITALSLCAVGTIFHILYIVRIGGDYMADRFLCLPFLIGLVCFLRECRLTNSAAYMWPAAAGLVSLLSPCTPWLMTRAYRGQPMTATGIRDERGAYNVTNR